MYSGCMPRTTSAPLHITHLHVEPKAGEHGEAPVLDLLHLELSERVGVISQGCEWEQDTGQGQTKGSAEQEGSLPKLHSGCKN